MAIWGKKSRVRGPPQILLGGGTVGMSYRLPSHGPIENICEVSMGRGQDTVCRHGGGNRHVGCRGGHGWWGTARRQAWLEYGSRQSEREL